MRVIQFNLLDSKCFEMGEATNCLEEIKYHDASREQIQFFLYHNNQGNPKDPQIFRMDIILSDPNITLLEKSLEILIRRNEGLRTYFEYHDKTLKQCILPYDGNLYGLMHYDVTLEANRNSFIRNRLNEVENEFKKLNQPPLFKAFLFQYNEAEFHFCILMHHIISDEWSKLLIKKELTSLYQSLINGKLPSYKDNRLQLVDYARWQLDWLDNNKDALVTYWKRHLVSKESEFLFNLFGNANHYKRQTKVLYNLLDTVNSKHNYSNIEFSLYRDLISLAKILKISIFSIINSCIKIVILLSVKRKSTIISTPLMVRHIPGMVAIIGCLMGTIYLTESINDEMTLSEVLTKTYFNFLNAARNPIFNHGDIEIHPDLRLQVDIFLNFISKDILGEKKMPLPPYENIYNENPEYFPLSVHVFEYQDGLHIDWRFNPDFYKEETISFLAKRFKDLLTVLTPWANSRICDLPEFNQ